MAFNDYIPLMEGALGAMTSAVGSTLNYKNSKKLLEQQNAYNLEMANYQYDKNLEAWNMQNQYNSPVEQMKRLEEAGLNPHLMYGQGNVGNASSVPQFEAPRSVGYQNLGADFGLSESGRALMHGLGSYLQLKKTNAEIDSIRQSTINKQTQNDLLELDKIYRNLRNSKTEDEAKVWQQVLESKLSLIDSQKINNYSSAQLKDVERFGKELMLPYIQQHQEAIIADRLASVGVKRQTILKLQEDIRFKQCQERLINIQYDIYEIDREVKNQTFVSDVEYKRLKSQEAYYKKEIERIGATYGIRPGKMENALMWTSVHLGENINN